MLKNAVAQKKSVKECGNREHDQMLAKNPEDEAVARWQNSV